MSRTDCRCLRLGRRCRTVELTRRRESRHPSPHRASYETRSRRSRPTILLCARYSQMQGCPFGHLPYFTGRTDRIILRDREVPAATRTRFSFTTLKPGLSTVIREIPGGTGARNSPISLVSKERDVEPIVMVTLAPATTAPITSVTTPPIVPVSVCAVEAIAQVNTIVASRKFDARFIMGKHLTMAFSCGARAASKLKERSYLRSMLSRRQLQGSVGRRTHGNSDFSPYFLLSQFRYCRKSLSIYRLCRRCFFVCAATAAGRQQRSNIMTVRFMRVTPLVNSIIRVFG
jgi:hypothetical protein